MLIVGCGYTGERVARKLLAQRQPVSVAVRSMQRKDYLQAQRMNAFSCDLDHAHLSAVSTADQPVFYFVPPPATGQTDTRLQNFLSSLASSGQPRRVVYISTTGVYGDCAGAWVDESRPVQPQTDRARRRWHAEQLLQHWRKQTGGELVILRVAGIYGLNKLPLARLRKGEPMIAPADAPWSNRIHVDDLVEVCIQAMQHGQDGEVYNVCDDEPGTMADYFNQVADMAGLPRPPVISLQEAQTTLSAGLLSYLQESRRLSNRKLREELGVALRYPSLAIGLLACGTNNECPTMSKSICS